MNVADRTKENVLALIEQHQDRIRAAGVKRLGLFGSFARGEQEPGSDIDLLVDFQPEQKSFDNFINLAFFLEELLGRRVELVTVESLSPYLRHHIMEEVEYVTFSN